MNDEFEVKPAKEVGKKRWNSFVLSHPDGNIFQTMEMVEVYSRTRHFEPIAVAAMNSSDEVLALMNAVVMKEREGFLGKFTSRAIVQIGPLFSQSKKGYAAASALLTYYEELATRKALFTQVRMIYQMPRLRKLLTAQGYTFEPHLTFFIDLEENVELVWRKLHKSRRKGINRAKRHGLVVKELHDKKYIRQFYRFMEETYWRVGVPFEDMSIFNAVVDVLIPKNMAKFFGCFHEREFIGGRMSLTYKGRIYDWHAGVSEKKLDLYPNELLVWHILAWGCRNGYKLFDFMGAGKPGEEYGPREFKRRFGGRLEHYDRYEKVHCPIRLAFSRKVYKFYKWMRV